MLIRPEREEDFDTIERILRDAFSGDYESRLVSEMRTTDEYVPQLTLVAIDDDGAVVGHVMLSRVRIGAEVALALGPVAVAPAVQRRGIGMKLVSAALAAADGTIYDTSVVLGDPSYYRRFFYVPASQTDVYPPVPWPDEYFMVRRAADSALRGMVLYPAVWKISGGDLCAARLRRATVADAATIARVFKISFRCALLHLPILHTAEEDVQFFTGELENATGAFSASPSRNIPL